MVIYSIILVIQANIPLSTFVVFANGQSDSVQYFWGETIIIIIQFRIRPLL